jgi:hypothetical protein
VKVWSSASRMARKTLLVVPYLFARLRKGNDGKTAHGVFQEAIDA